MIPRSTASHNSEADITLGGTATGNVSVGDLSEPRSAKLDQILAVLGDAVSAARAAELLEQCRGSPRAAVNAFFDSLSAGTLRECTHCTELSWILTLLALYRWSIDGG